MRYSEYQIRVLLSLLGCLRGLVFGMNIAVNKTGFFESSLLQFAGAENAMGALPNRGTYFNFDCIDLFYVCPSYKSLCNTDTQLDSIPINQACRFTCESCTNSPFYSINGCVDKDKIYCPILSLFCQLRGANVNGVPVRDYCPYTCGTCQNVCIDQLSNCQLLLPYCNQQSATYNGQPINYVCPVTCGICPYNFNNLPNTVTQPNDCVDKNSIICASFSAYCDSGAYLSGIPIREYCPKTCSCCDKGSPHLQITINIPIPDVKPTGTCSDTSFTCTEYAQYCTLAGAKINNIPITTYCPYTCGTCSSVSCDDIYPMLCQVVGDRCNIGTVIINGYPIKQFCKKTCNSC